MKNILLILEYEGTSYHGWQVQKNAESIQPLLERALGKILGEPVSVTASGRTDAGVHAMNQPVSFRTSSDIEASRLLRGVNALLPDDIVVKSVEEVSDDFNARRSARSKTYRYVILNREAPSALDRHRCWHIRKRLDSDLIRKGAEILVGEHDFSSFRASGCGARHPVRRVLGVKVFRGESPYDCEIQICARKGHEEGTGGASPGSTAPFHSVSKPGAISGHEIRDKKYDFIIFEIEAHAFLKQMVRNIVGTLVAFGLGRITIDEFRAILDAKDRSKAGITAPPHGLYLVKVKY